MAEDGSSESGIEGSAGTQTGAAHAMALASASREKADRFLEKQSRLADLQIENLEKQDEFELSHLRFRRFGDYARFALEIAAGLVILLIVCGLGSMVWSATRDSDLVVDAFSVPPDVAQTGLTGSVLANRILDRFGTMDRHTPSFTQDFSSYHGNTREEVRVEIPDTGISIGELNRYLRTWLGHETHVTGELVRTGKGLSLTVRYGDDPGTTVGGTADDLDGLMQKGAEAMYHSAKPLRFADYLSSHGRIPEAETIVREEAHTGSSAHHSDAYVALAWIDYQRGDAQALVSDGVSAVRLNPRSTTARYVALAGANNLDHEEEHLRQVTAILPLAESGEATAENSDLAHNLIVGFEADIKGLAGDYKGDVDACRETTTAAVSAGDCNFGGRIENLASLHDIAQARARANEVPEMRINGKPNIDLLIARTQIELSAGNWAEAVAVSKKAETASAKDPASFSDRDVFLWPPEAEALARNGDLQAARALIARTALDCDQCARTRGRIAMLAHDWSGAARWFALVSARTPHIPFADTDWGAMLLAKGDFEGAIAKFQSAHAKGPFFADPLEMWGEALIAKNRSDLAVAKFAEADKYAPNWGRLHLKWGEALLWAGKKDEAKMQFAIAAGLDLSSSERTALAKWMKSHG